MGGGFRMREGRERREVWGGMGVCARMCACVCACACVRASCVRACACVRAFVRVRACVRVCARVRVCAYECVRACVRRACVRACARVCVCEGRTCACVCVRARARARVGWNGLDWGMGMGGWAHACGASRAPTVREKQSPAGGWEGAHACVCKQGPAGRPADEGENRPGPAPKSAFPRKPRTWPSLAQRGPCHGVAAAPRPAPAHRPGTPPPPA